MIARCTGESEESSAVRDLLKWMLTLESALEEKATV